MSPEDTSVTRYGFHADAQGEDGMALPDMIWGWDMPVLGDFRELDAAYAWADRIFRTDARVMSIIIVSMIAAPHDCWKRESMVDRIERGDTPGPVYTIEPAPESNHWPDEDHWRVVAPEGAHGGGALYGTKEFAQAAADRLAKGVSLRRR